MKPFRFRLGRVLRVRQLLEDAARGELAAGRAEERTAEERVETATSGVLSSLQCERAFRETGTFAPSEALSRERQTERLREILAVRRAARLQARQAADVLETQWRERRRDVEALEKMRDSALEAWNQEQFAQEQAESDEATSARAARNLKEPSGPVDSGRSSVSDAEVTR